MNYKILYKFATKNRPNKFLKVLNNLLDNISSIDNSIILISIDEDDESMNNDYIFNLIKNHIHSNILNIYTSKSIGKIDATNRDIEKIQDWDIVVNIADDFEFISFGFDDVIRNNMLNHYPNLDGVLHFPDGVHNEIFCTHPVIGRNYYNRFNYIFNPQYKSLYCDNEFTDVARLLNKITYVPYQFYKHIHPSFDLTTADELYFRNESYFDVDKELYFNRKKINFGINKNKMKITQVTPGLIPVPPNGWGAVEKIIWNYKLNFEKMGHECDVTYLNYVDTDSDIIHIHVANLAIEAKERGIPYIFSLHDHHVVRHGKNSGPYLENLEAIKGSIISFTHAEFLVDYFDETDKLFYLSHGVDTEYFSYFHI